MDQNIAWYEKYRPWSFGQVLSQDLRAIETMADNNQIPHLLILGRPGTGKRTTAMLIADRLLGPANLVKGLGIFDGNKVNGGDFRESKIYQFSRTILPEITYCPRVCYIFNADGLPWDFLFDLHHYLLRVPDNMRVVFSCKEDRCPHFERKFRRLFGRIVLRFKPIAPQLVYARLLRICQQENLNWNCHGIQALVDMTRGNLKLAIAYLQLASLLSLRVDFGNIMSIRNRPNPLEVYQVIKCCLRVDFTSANGMVIGFYQAGHTYQDILAGIHCAIYVHNPIQDFIRAKYLEVMQHVPHLLPFARNGYDNLRMLMHILCDISARSKISVPLPLPSSSSSSSSSSSTSTSATVIQRPTKKKASVVPSVQQPPPKKQKALAIPNVPPTNDDDDDDDDDDDE